VDGVDGDEQEELSQMLMFVHVEVHM
jgi:hypothetical protein